MTYETETGFGSGLRAQLERNLGVEPSPTAEEQPEEAVESVDRTVVPLLDAPDLPAVDPVQVELEAALDREQQLREALEHQVEAYERELTAGGDLRLRETEAEQLAARLDAARAQIEEQELMIRIQRDQLETDRSEIAAQRSELVAEEARVVELASHIDSRSLELESAANERAQAAAHLAQQLAAIAERERELKRERAAIDARRVEAETHLTTREDAIARLDAAAVRREQAVAQRELEIHRVIAAAARERAALDELAEVVATREVSADKRNDARERMLTNGEAALAAREKRLREQAERLDRERAGHGQASQEAFALLAELEQREEGVRALEAKALAAEAQTVQRANELAASAEELRRREARLGVDLDIREDRLDEREHAIAERERCIAERERDLGVYVGQLQDQFSDRSVA
ncbi:MAG: hypothetical protein QOF75_2730 [Gaiellaceae bacterium]|nr:hypothetical protein [Gaiellaceae bacterium]